MTDQASLTRAANARTVTGGAGAEIEAVPAIRSVGARRLRAPYLVAREHQIHVGDRPVVTARITYVGVEAGTSVTAKPPARVRAHLGEPPDAPS